MPANATLSLTLRHRAIHLIDSAGRCSPVIGCQIRSRCRYEQQVLVIDIESQWGTVGKLNSKSACPAVPSVARHLRPKGGPVQASHDQSQAWSPPSKTHCFILRNENPKSFVEVRVESGCARRQDWGQYQKSKRPLEQRRRCLGRSFARRPNHP